MNLNKLSNQDLNYSLKSLVQKERELLTEILWHIREVDRRELHLAMGYASLFAYLTEYLGYSAASSQRRIDAARLLIELPEVSEMIVSGKINLSQVSMLQQSAREAKRVHQHKVATQTKKETLLQIEHIKPIWAGGTDEPQNLTTLCANHNRYLYKKQSGLQRVL